MFLWILRIVHPLFARRRGKRAGDFATLPGCQLRAFAFSGANASLQSLEDRGIGRLTLNPQAVRKIVRYETLLCFRQRQCSLFGERETADGNTSGTFHVELSESEKTPQAA
jgi:hypothetical protein